MAKQRQGLHQLNTTFTPYTTLFHSSPSSYDAGWQFDVVSFICRAFPLLLLLSQFWYKAKNNEASLYDAYNAAVSAYGSVRNSAATKWLAGDLAGFFKNPYLAMVWCVLIMFVAPGVLYYQNNWGQ